LETDFTDPWPRGWEIFLPRDVKNSLRKYNFKLRGGVQTLGDAVGDPTRPRRGRGGPPFARSEPHPRRAGGGGLQAEVRRTREKRKGRVDRHEADFLSARLIPTQR